MKNPHWFHTVKEKYDNSHKGKRDTLNGKTNINKYRVKIHLIFNIIWMSSQKFLIFLS